MHRFLLPAGMALAALVAFDSVFEHRLRLQELERIQVCGPEQLVALRRSLATERERQDAELVARLERELAASRAREAEGRQWIERLESRVAGQATRLEVQEREWVDWQADWSEFSPHMLRRKLFELHARSEAQQSDLELAAQLSRDDTSRVLRDVSRLESRLELSLNGPSPDQLWDELVGPVVQLVGETTVGSGVLLASRPTAGGEYATHVLTAWHVVRDILGKPDDLAAPVSIKVYAPDGTWRTLRGRTLARDVGLDLALLQLDTKERLPFGARLATREQLEALRTFDGVYAVGCPLGNDPIPTLGELASTHHEVDGSKYWMISAPTYIGNSGGGIYAARSRTLIGIFSKIYTHGSTRSTIVPHMGLATPLTVVYDWLDGTEYAYLENPPVDATAAQASMTR